MKNVFFIVIAYLLCVTGVTGTASALTISDVGGVDLIQYRARLDNSGDATELNWVNTVLGGGYIMTFKDEKGDADWIWRDITDRDYTFAYDMGDDPAYFLIKVATRSGSDFTHFLFSNDDNWAVIDLEAMGFSLKNIENVGKVSHIDGFDKNQPVPEPASMLLLGTGLTGLALRQRKKAKKN